MNMARTIRRSALEIRYEVLQVIAKDDKPTHVMYHANLSWTSLQKTFKYLLKRKLIRTVTKQAKTGKRKVTHLYYITPLGEKTLNRLGPHLDILRGRD